MEFEFLLNERAGDDLAVNSGRRITVPLARAVRESPSGVPAFAPEVVLFYKAGGNLAEHGPTRPRDQHDFDALAPTFDAGQRSWLRESVGRAHSGHPWLAALIP